MLLTFRFWFGIVVITLTIATGVQTIRSHKASAVAAVESERRSREKLRVYLHRQLDAIQARNKPPYDHWPEGDRLAWETTNGGLLAIGEELREKPR